MKKHLVHLNNGHDRYCNIEVTGNSYHITWGRTGTVGQSAIRTFARIEDCTKEAEELISMKRGEGYLDREESFIKRYELPAGVKEAMNEERTMDVLGGALFLPKAEDIRIISIIVNHLERPDCSGSGPATGNPFEEVNGIFCGTAYCLIENTGAWQGSVVWLPMLETYGLWVEKYRQLYIFPTVAWTEIEKDIARYMVTNDEHNTFPNVLCRVKIWEYFDFIPDDFTAQAVNIFHLPGEKRRREAEAFLGRYERRLLRHPFCHELEKPFQMLVKIYHFLGQSFEEEAQYAKAVAWFEHALLVLDQVPHFRNLFADIFLQLSFCYMEMSRFDLSLIYIDQYQLYDPSASDACEQIRNSVHRIQHMYHSAMESYRNAMALKTQEYFEKAIQITLQAITLAPNDPVLYFNLACFFSMSGRATEALYYLEKALQKGFRDREKIYEDADLKNIRCLKEFEYILARYFPPSQA